MRSMMLYKPDREINRPPRPQEDDAKGQLIGKIAKTGVLIGTEDRQPTSNRRRVRISGKKFIVTDGPFAETKE
jgi:hypothetical protein